MMGVARSGFRFAKASLLRILLISTVVMFFTAAIILRVRPEFGVHYWTFKQHFGRMTDTMSTPRPTKPITFTPVNGKGLFTFHDVCIENKKIVVYNSSERTVKQFRVPTHVNVHVSRRYWDLNFTTEPLDASKASSMYNTAFFIIPTCHGNLHHFWTDVFVNFFDAVKRSHSLGSAEPIHVLYRFEWRTRENQSCHNVKRYSIITQTANVADDDDWFGAIPSGTCYKNAVFGRWGGNDGTKSAFVMNHVMTELGLSRDQCSQYTITLINRKKRRILNMDKLVTVLKDAGYNNTQVVDFAGLSIREQMNVAICSSVFVGITGAGLQWGMFMKKGSLLVEIAWPKQHWGYYYKDRLRGYGVKQVTLEATDVHLNWTSYETEVRNGVKVSDDERQRLSSMGPLKRPSDNHWKWADVNINPARLLSALKRI